MRKFYDTYHGVPKLSALLRELSWTNNLIILDRCKSREEQELYLRLVAEEKWSSRELGRQIDSALFERSVRSPAKLSTVLRVLHPKAEAVFKDFFIDLLFYHRDLQYLDE